MFFKDHHALRPTRRAADRRAAPAEWPTERPGAEVEARTGASHDPSARLDPPAVVTPEPSGEAGADLRRSIATASFAFRGYDVANQGRSAELLAHPAYGPSVARRLKEASAVAAETLGRPFDLVQRVREAAPSSLETFAEDVATIVAMELAQIDLLGEFFGIEAASARQSFGYSVGEMSSLVSSGVFRVEDLLPVPLSCADDCAELADGTTLGVLFSRGPALSLPRVQELCTEISGEGKGLIGASSYLAPNTMLVIGQGGTLERLESAAKGSLPGPVMLRRKSHLIPPLHTPLVWHKNIPNRAATALYQIAARAMPPAPRVVSCVTGLASYDPLTARDLLVRWVDHPQRLWDVVDETLRSGVDTVVHVGPAPNLVPATFERLGNNVTKALGNRHRYLKALGQGVGSSMNRYSWLARLLPSRAALLRVPHMRHIVLEDWLLGQPLP